MKPNKKKRRLSEIDFSQEGAHIALVSSDVGGPANGYDKPLILKSMKNFSAEGIQKMQEIKVTYKLPEFLEKVMGLYYENAHILARMMGYKEDREDKEETVGDFQDYIESRLAAFEIMKSAYESKDLPSYISSLKEDDYIDLLEDQARLEKCMEVKVDATDAQSEAVGVKEEEEVHKAAVSFKAGQFVKWKSSGGTAYGKVKKVTKSGSIRVPGSSFEITADSDNPAVLIQLYKKDSNGWMPTDTLVGHKATALTKVNALRKSRNSNTQTTEVIMAKENNDVAEITVDVVEKSQFELVQKQMEEQKEALTKALEQVEAFKAEKREMIRKARRAALDEVVLDEDQSEILFKAFGDVQDEELYGNVIDVLKAMKSAVEASNLLKEEGVSEEAEIEKGQTALIHAFLKKQYNK